MTSDGTTLWGLQRKSNGAWLVTIDKATAALTQITTTADFGIGESSPFAIAWDGTDLWVVGSTLKALIRVDRTTGLGTRIGSATNYGVNEDAMSGLTFDGTNLYGAGRGQDALFTIDRTTGVGARVGTHIRFGRDIRNSHALVSTDFPAPANTAPTWTTTQTVYTLPANVAVNVVVATLVAADVDNDTLTYTLTGTDAALFTISAAGVVTVASALSNDTTYDVTAVVSDSLLQATLDLSIVVAAPGEMITPEVPVTPTIPSGVMHRLKGFTNTGNGSTL